jgi:putative ABC transport system permease protein
LQTFKMELIAGRDFSPAQPLDTIADRVIINETLARQLGWTPEEAIGKVYDRGGDGENIGEVIGVLKDFNFTSVKNETSPIVLAYIPYFFDKAVVRLSGTEIKSNLEVIGKVWSSVFPSRPFDFRFADEAVQQQYQSEVKFGKLFNYFSALAILIGVLGLFGMVNLDLNLRTKEVGIRKVLGANLTHLVSVLSKDFLKLIVIAFVISMPLSFWLAQQWLANFAYRLPSIMWLIAIPPLGVVALALLSVFGQTVKSSLTNPVDSLRNE